MAGREKFKRKILGRNRSSESSLVPQQDLPAPSQASGGTGPATQPADTVTFKSPRAVKRSHNVAFQTALEKYVHGLPEKEKRKYSEAALEQITPETLVSAINSRDVQHKENSRMRAHSEKLAAFFILLQRFTGIVSIGTQAAPEFANIIVGAVQVVIGVAAGFVTFFDRLSEMLCHFGDYLGPLNTYAEHTRNSDLVQASLEDVYVDLLEFCRKARRVFEREDGSLRKNVTWRTFWRNHWAPFEEDFRQIEGSFSHHLEKLMHSTQAEILRGSAEVDRAEKDRKQREQAIDREAFLNWVSELNFEDIHEKMFAQKHPRTGDWLLVESKFQDWLDGPGSILWCHGKAGAGKSVLAANVIEYLTAYKAPSKEVGLAFAYCDYGNSNTHSLKKLVAALIKQLCRKPDTIPSQFTKMKKDALSPMQLGNLESFTTIAGVFKEVFIVIDALDECPLEKRPEVLGFLSEVTKIIARIKIFVTSRREPDIECEFSNTRVPVLRIDAANTNSDIKIYVSDEIPKLRTGFHGKRLYVKDETLVNEIVSVLTEKADGMFLWVYLQIESLCRASASQRDSDVRRALGRLPRGLDATYDRILKQISETPDSMKELAFRTFQWVLFTEEPLNRRGLKLALELYHLTDEDGEVDILDRAIDACGNLLEHDPSGRIRPIHYSVQERLSRTSLIELQSGESPVLLSVPEIHVDMARRCMDAANQYSAMLARFREQGTWRAKFLADEIQCYAARSFDFHLYSATPLTPQVIENLKAWIASSQSLRSNLLFLRTGGKHFHAEADASSILYSTRLYDIPEIRAQWDTTIPNDALDRACQAGLVSAVIHLLDAGAEIEEENDDGETPLVVACRWQRWPVARILVERGAKVDAKGREYGPPLQDACRYGRLDMVNLLILKGANINFQGGRYGNALRAACRSRREDVVELLIQKGATVNGRDPHFRNPLPVACKYGTIGIVKLLICKGADMNAPDSDGTGALYAACEAGDLGKVKFLIENDVNVKDSRGPDESPLHVAARLEEPDIAQVLLQNGADVNARGKPYGTALIAACTKQRLEVLEVLIQNGADVHFQGDRYGNALQAACAVGRLDMVEVLIRKGAKVNAPGGQYGSALQRACEGGYSDVVEFLLAKDADVNAPGGHNGNALQRACGGGHLDVVQLLLTKDADVNAPGQYGSALQRACEGGYLDVVQLLLTKDADVNAPGDYNGNALQRASARGRLDVVELLITKGANVNAPGGPKGSALQRACEKGYSHVVEFLLTKGADVNARAGQKMNAQVWHNENALAAACFMGRLDIVEKLIQKDADVNAAGVVEKALILRPWVSNRERRKLFHLLRVNGAKGLPSEEVNESDTEGEDPWMAIKQAGRLNMVNPIVEDD